MIKAFKTRIYPTQEQVIYFYKAFGIRRWTWNWAWNEYQKQPLSQYDLQKLLNNSLVKQEGYEWLSEVNSMVRQESLKDLFESIKAWKDPKRKNSKQPHYASKKASPNSFRLNSKGTPLKYVSPKFISMTRIRGYKPFKIKCAEDMSWMKSIAKVCAITVSEKAGHFYISITYETAKTKLNKVNNSRCKCGIDMGIKTPLVIWDGNDGWEMTIFDELRKAERRTEKLVSALGKKREANKKCRKQKYNSKRYEILKLRVQKAYEHEANIKKNWREQGTWWLVKHYNEINIEPYSIVSADNLNCSRAARRVGGYEFCERLKTKAEEYGTKINFISWEPTTQTCSNCGHKREGNERLTLNDRIYHCSSCGITIDRDLNAAKNIYKLTN